MSIKSKFDLNIALGMELPFNVKVSFQHMHEHWKERAQSEDPTEAGYAQSVLDQLDKAPEILVPFKDVDLLEKYAEEIKLLFSPAFPESLKKNEIKALSLPFQHFFFNPTQRFKGILDGAGDDFKLQMRDISHEDMYIFGCLFALNARFDAGLEFRRPFYFDIPDMGQKVMRHYRAFFNADFSTFKDNKNSPDLSEADIRELADNFDNVELWKEKIPPGSFDFEGVGIVTLFDVTPDESLSSMKNILLHKDALHSSKLTQKLETDLRAYLNIADLKLRFASFDSATCKLRGLGESLETFDLQVDDEGVAKVENSFCSYSANEVFKYGKPIAFSDMSTLPDDMHNPLMDRMRERGSMSLIVQPLSYEGKVIGFLELSSPTRKALNSLVLNKLQDVVPMYTIAMQRAETERETKLEAIVQDKFTSIHPTVEWKFFEAAEKVMDAQKNGQTHNVDDIVFGDVVPLFGQFDIRGSSTVRNQAIQADLVKQLNKAESVMDAAKTNARLPIYDQLKYRLQKYREELEKGINAGDEVKILDFLKAEIYPVFNHLASQDPVLEKAVAAYMGALDPDINVVYEERKAYEDSVTMINETIAEIVDEHQVKAQTMFPHYFEKYKTDGVEYNVYVGQSLVQNETYDNVYLHNLRLWQLLLTCVVENKMHKLKDELPKKLEIASLILAHNSPLAIKFRLDEKKFDVDGAYNIRYEIMKKRIDKAHIKGSDERLTQPGKLAIVYSQKDEAEEYKRYLEYLAAMDLIEEEVEMCELEDLQGTTGLKALRATLKYSEVSEDVDVQEVVAQMN